ncbi:ATPase PAAT isoform X2 [Desmodus rotundus]|uniref:ATPase PAAT isoform X2 n=1 Tax=Desmodus rotundus TaxID=9430 RepID=UPI002381175B|nr:ATPase PAAT isoform X2 [Desmodus rotundus]
METETEDVLLTRRPSLASSWDATCGALDQSLLVTRAGVGARDLERDELLAPPAPGQGLVILKRSLNSPEETPCFLFLRCDPDGGEEIVSVGILSSARNMEVYVGEEYCGTSRGQTVGDVLENSEHEKIILYKKYLKLEPSTYTCKIKLLSFGEKPCVFVSKVVVHMRPASANSATRSPAAGARVDLQRVQTIMRSMGSELSPGAQQLMTMVRFQQQKASDCSGPPNSELLPLLQNLCGQVNGLRVGRNAEWPGTISKPSDTIAGVAMGEQPVCSYLEKILSKNMELMERRLTDYIDQRIHKLQEHIDGKIALLVDLLHNPSSPPHWDASETF